jgi:DNA polymerase III alpha subunit
MAEGAGLVKFDFLGLKTLTVLQARRRHDQSRRRRQIDLADLPLDDKAHLRAARPRRDGRRVPAGIAGMRGHAASR